MFLLAKFEIDAVGAQKDKWMGGSTLFWKRMVEETFRFSRDRPGKRQDLFAREEQPRVLSQLFFSR